MKSQPIYVAVFGLFSCAVSAQSAHQHGVAELFFAASGEELEIEIHSPADNFLGFEHVPANPEQQKILDDAKLQASQATALFSFAGGECELEDVNQQWGDLGQGASSHDDHDHAAHEEHTDHDDHEHAAHDEHTDHDDHEHAAHDEHTDHDDHEHTAHDEHTDHDDHEHAAHDEHTDHDNHDHEKHASHSDVRLSYHFHCHHLDELESFNVELFKFFPRMEKIQVQGASERGQVAFDITPAQNKVKL